MTERRLVVSNGRWFVISSEFPWEISQLTFTVVRQAVNAQSLEVTRVCNSGTVLVCFRPSNPLLAQGLEFVQSEEHKGLGRDDFEPRRIENSHRGSNGHTPGSDGNSARTL